MRKKTLILLTVIFAMMLLLIIASCGKNKTEAALLKPDPNELDAQAPDVFKIKFETSKGDFVMEVHRDWSPHGADRLYYLAKHGFYDGVKFFRVIDGFMAQFGYHGDPEVIAAWRNLNIPDDPVVQSNKRGYVSFAKSSLPNSRTTQLFSQNIRLLDIIQFRKVFVKIFISFFLDLSLTWS